MDLKTENPEGRIRELTGELEALSSSISHDLRAPLRAVTGFSQILLRNHSDRLDPDYSDRLFRMFHRLHPAEQFEGIGSGLAIARRIVRRHGGRIWAESQPGVGTALYFIPC